MKSLTNFLDELRESCNIDFMIVSDNNEINFNSNKDIKEPFKIDISLGKTQAYIVIDRKFKMNAKLLKYIINSKFKEELDIREKIINSILAGENISMNIIEKNLSFILNGSISFVIYLNEKHPEALSILKQLYDEEEVVIAMQGKYLILSGVFENPLEHAESIRDAIFSNMFSKCYIGFYKASYDIESFKESIERAKEAVEIGLMFGLKGEIFHYDDIIFEKIISDMNYKTQNELIVKFRDFFNSFDTELMRTIEEFFNCGLSISDAAKVLYVHRNTLIYRLDKIFKETGYDLRVFKDAVIFLVSFLLWKKYKGKIL